MIMENNTEVPSPFITAKQLNSFLHKPVIVAGKVVSVNESTMTLDGGDPGKVNVVRSKPSQAMIEPGMNIMVRGFVNQDLTIAESKNFPATDLGESFGKLNVVLCIYKIPSGEQICPPSNSSRYTLAPSSFSSFHMRRHETVQ